MARRPFFSGDYGSALGSYDTAARLLAQAGQTQGAAMAGLGGNIAGAIEKYGLNKEREKKANARIKATIQGLDSYVEAGVITDAQRLQAKEMLQNPDASSSEKVAFIEQQEKQLFQLPKALLAKAQAGNAVLQNEITNRTKDFEVRSKELSNALLESQGVLAALKASGYTEEQKAAIEDLRAQTEGRRVTAAKTIAETEQVGRPKPFVQRTIPDEPGDYQTPTGVYRRETPDGPLIKVGTPSEGGGGIVAPDTPTDPSAQAVDPGEIIDPATAAGGDIPGWSSDMANAIGGVFGLNPFPDRTKAVNQLKILNQEVRPLLVKDLSKLGAVSLVEKMDAIMPIPSDNNAELKQKMKGLVGLMETRRKDLEKIDKAVQDGQMKVDDVRKREIGAWLTRLPKQIAILKASMGTARDIPREILEITGELGAPEPPPPAGGIEGVSGDELIELLLEKR